MQRSPAIIWLLLAATAAVDAVAIFGIDEQSPGAAAGALYDALSFGQLSLVSMWVVFAPRRRRSLGLLAMVVAVSVVAAMTALVADFPVWETAAIYGSHVTVLTLLLWIVKQTRFWRGGNPPRRSNTWQFSVGQLLILMTVVALLVASLRDSELTQSRDARGVLFVVVAAHVLLGAASVLVWSRPWRPVLRLAAMLALGGMIGWAAERWVSPYSTLAVQTCLIEVFLIFAWLEIGRIIPWGEPTDDETAAPPAGPGRTT